MTLSAAYLPPMNFFSRMSPFTAIRDLRVFLSHRQKHELAFLALSVVITTLLIAGFVKDSHIEKVYKRDIIYVQNWRADRTDEEVRAQQAKDLPGELARKEAFAKKQAERRAQFKRVDDKLESWGL